MARFLSARSQEFWSRVGGPGTGVAVLGIAGKALAPLGAIALVVGLTWWPIVGVIGASVAAAGVAAWWWAASSLARRAGTSATFAAAQLWSVPTWTVLSDLFDLFDAVP